jgi:hypothetical protein
VLLLPLLRRRRIPRRARTITRRLRLRTPRRDLPLSTLHLRIQAALRTQAAAAVRATRLLRRIRPRAKMALLTPPPQVTIPAVAAALAPRELPTHPNQPTLPLLLIALPKRVIHPRNRNPTHPRPIPAKAQNLPRHRLPHPQLFARPSTRLTIIRLAQ